MTSPHTTLAALTILLTLGTGAHAQTGRAASRATPSPTALEVARMGFVEGGVEIRRPGGAWTRVAENEPLSMGDRVRTLPGGTARLEFPWTAIAVGDGTEVSLQKNRVLTLELLQGRLDIDPEQSLLRILTEEAAISGSGRTLVRREGGTTFVGSYSGGAEVEGKGKVVRLGINKGTLASASGPAEPQPLGPAPRVVSPSADPRYVRPGQPVALKWAGKEKAYHLEVLSIDSDVPVMSLDLDGASHDLRLNWLGTFRWRVSGRSGPVESEPSGEGLICVVEK